VVSPTWGYPLIVGVGLFYASVLRPGLWLTHRLPQSLAILALPVTGATIEFVKYIAPVVQDWWFVMLPASQWPFLAALLVNMRRREASFATTPTAVVAVPGPLLGSGSGITSHGRSFGDIGKLPRNIAEFF